MTSRRRTYEMLFLLATVLLWPSSARSAEMQTMVVPLSDLSAAASMLGAAGLVVDLDATPRALDADLHGRVALPDLRIANVFFWSTSNFPGTGKFVAWPDPGQTVFAHYFFFGSASPPLNNVRARLEIDGIQLCEGIHSDVTDGFGFLVACAWNATPGGHTLTGRVDPLGQIAEADETNNVRQVAFTTGQTVSLDLKATGVVFRNAPFNGGQIIDQPQVSQQLYAVAQYDVVSPILLSGRVLEIFIDGQSLCLGNNTYFPSHPSGSSNFACSGAWTVTPGPHVLTAVLDAHGDFEETNESNNVASFSFGGGGECPQAPELSCGSVVQSNTAGAQSSDTVDDYPCLASPHPGREVVYSFRAPAEGDFTVTIPGDSVTADLDLVVIRGEESGCDVDQCVAASDASGLATEEVSFKGLGGEEFLIVVDSRTAATSPFTLQLTCPHAPDANFQVVPPFPTAGQQVTFFDLSTGRPIEFHWSFGDGGMAASENPVHTFASPGTFPVSLTVGNPAGSDTLTRSVVVSPANGVIDVTGPTMGEASSPLSFSAQAVGCQPAANGWEWLPAGGEIVSSPNQSTVAVRWPSAGLKTLTARNSSCGTAQDVVSVDVHRSGAVTPPAAPTAVRAISATATEVVVGWNDNSNNEDGFRIERLENGVYREIGRAPANATSASVSLAGVPFPTTTRSTLRVLAFNAAGDSPTPQQGSLSRALASNEVELTAEPDSCDSDQSLCLLQKRFRVEVTWVARNFAPGQGIGHAVALTEDTGYFWFFNPENVELVVKVLDGRPISNPPSYWVFFGALSNVEYTIRVTDTETGNVKEYFNPRTQFASVGDTSALPSEELAGSSAWSDRRPASAEEVAFKRLSERALSVDFTVSPLVGRTEAEILLEDVTQPLSPLRLRSWGFGDGSAALTVNGVFARYDYDQPGTYDVTLEVTDLLGSFLRPPDARTRQVVITPPVEPALNLRGPEETAVGELATFSVAADASCSPAFRGWKWDVNGGTIQGRDNRPAIDVTWNDDGPRTVTVSNSRCGDAAASLALIVSSSQGASAAVGRADEPACESADDILCLVAGRFQVDVTWTDFQNHTGSGQAERVSNETGYFWFFEESNVELIVKVLDGRAINGNFWVFYGALSNVGYTIRVTDTLTGRVRTYTNPSRTFGSRGDTTAFPGN